MGLLQDLASRLAVPGLPDWTGLLALILLTLVGLAYLLMPFAVFGVKGRLEAIEAQLDEIQAEMRSLGMRGVAGGGGAELARRSAALAADDWVDPPSMRRGAAASATPEEEPSPRVSPPIPPPARWPDGRPTRAEPRLDWPDRGRRGGGG
jgi:hypothetical protein